jgi:hypothetical protein
VANVSPFVPHERSDEVADCAAQEAAMLSKEGSVAALLCQEGAEISGFRLFRAESPLLRAIS